MKWIYDKFECILFNVFCCLKQKQATAVLMSAAVRCRASPPQV